MRTATLAAVPRGLTILVTAAAVLAPLSLIFYQSFLTAPFFDARKTAGFEAYEFIFADPDFWVASLNSVILATMMVVIAVPTGSLLAFRVFGLPLVLGDPEGHLVLSTYLYKLTNKLGTPSYHLMAAVAICIVAVTFPLVLLQRYLLQNARKYATIKGKAGRMRELPLRRWKWVAAGLIGLWLFVGVIVPLSGVALRAFVSNWGYGAKLADVLTFEHFLSVWDEPTQVRAIWNTILIGTVGGAIAVACYTAIGFATHRRNDGWSR